MNDSTLASQKSGYRHIFRATSLFGGVQIFNILIAVVRSKIIAVLLGPEGMGIAGLLTSTTALVGSLTNFGVGTSAVRNVAAADASGDASRTATVVVVLRRLVWITGLLGTLTTIALSPWLSQITFGNRDHTLEIIWISVTLLLSQISSGQMVVLQGMRKLKYLAQANMTGALLGLLISAPIYYFWQIDGIVPAIVLTSAVSLARSWYFARKIPVQKVAVSRRITIAEGKDMLHMGVMLSLNGLITTAAAYTLRIFISNKGGVEQVGLYNAGFTIIATYVGMVFTAMGTDYYPRLSGVAHDNGLARDLVNQQAEIAVLILAPILTVFLILIGWVIVLLYSEEFLVVKGMVQWAGLGMYFKAVSWAISYILLAKGASKLFFWSELVANLYLLGLNALGYRLAGLTGLGISFLAGYIAYFGQVFLIARSKYDFRFSRSFYQVFAVQLSLGLLCFLATKQLEAPWLYVVGAPLVLISVGYSLYELDRRMNLGSFLGLYLARLGIVRR